MTLLCTSQAEGQTSKPISGQKRPRKVSAPNAPPKSKYSVVPFSFTFFRFMQTEQAGESSSLMYNQTGLNTPASTFLLSTFSLRTSSQARSSTDFSTFSSTLSFYSPQYSGLGLVGAFSSAGAGTDTWRGGPYFVFGSKFGTLGLIVVNHLVLTSATIETGRFYSLWSLAYANSLIVSTGTLTYSWDNQSQPNYTTTNFSPVVSIKLYQSLRFALLYNLSATGDRSTSSTGLGLEVYQSF
jgi:hypothetical protein